jgi:two-component system nitrogen regulation sensor histidine kinase NtrY
LGSHALPYTADWENMSFKQVLQHSIFRTIALFGLLLLAAIVLVKQWYLAELIIVPFIIYLLYDVHRYHQRAVSEIEQFVESVKHRDFSRHFNVTNTPLELQAFRKGFNEINASFKSISKEKETQFLYLKNILEIVDTGILSYEMDSGEVLWMNESLKSLLQIPYLKTIHSLEKRNELLYTEIRNLLRGQKTVTAFSRDNTAVKLLLSATMFENEHKTYKLIAFQNINDALDEGESQAWQKLLSVMTHEIMNSVAPISSLAETLKNRITEAAMDSENYKDTLADIETGITTIKKRSEGLLKFTETYRNLSKINKVNRAPVYAAELFEHVQQLLQPGIDQKAIEFDVILKDPLLSVNVDSALIEQVLINLVLNAMDAVKEVAQPKISLSAESLDQKILIKIVDNGLGIPPELLDKIFIPFFSTKKTGNGIGLSLCKQVMMLHKGHISVKSAENEGTAFLLMFD